MAIPQMALGDWHCPCYGETRSIRRHVVDPSTDCGRQVASHLTNC
ncbi:MAG: hypothetical protein RIK87_20665 [Fuerstiella sp.]